MHHPSVGSLMVEMEMPCATHPHTHEYSASDSSNQKEWRGERTMDLAALGFCDPRVHMEDHPNLSFFNGRS